MDTCIKKNFHNILILKVFNQNVCIPHQKYDLYITNIAEGGIHTFVIEKSVKLARILSQ